MVPVPTWEVAILVNISRMSFSHSFNYERLVVYITTRNEEQNLQNFLGDILSLDFCVCELFVFNERSVFKQQGAFQV